MSVFILMKRRLLFLILSYSRFFVVCIFCWFLRMMWFLGIRFRLMSGLGMIFFVSDFDSFRI